MKAEREWKGGRGEDRNRWAGVAVSNEREEGSEHVEGSSNVKRKNSNES